MAKFAFAASIGGPVLRAADLTLSVLVSKPARFVLGAFRAQNKAGDSKRVRDARLAMTRSSGHSAQARGVSTIRNQASRGSSWIPAFAGMTALVGALGANAATPPNTPVTNTATASYDVGGTVTTSSGSVTLTTNLQTPARIDFLQYIPAGTSGTMQAVQPTQCSRSGTAGGPYAPSSGPTAVGSATPLTVPGVYRLADTLSYGTGEPIFIRVTDFDENLDPAALDTLIVTVTSQIGDSELVRLTETGVSAGIFTGYIQSTGGASVVNDCQLSVGKDQNIDARYVDASDAGDAASDAALFDPFGVVFDSSNGNPIDGVTVTLVNVVTGSPAAVFCDDGVTPHPGTVVTGSTFSACGGDITLPAGSYRFPRVAPDTYRLQITAPAGYAFPSTVADARLQTLPGAPFALVVGSRGENFIVNPGPSLEIDVPLDPSAGSLQIVKVAGKSLVAIGDFVPYTLTIRNTNTGGPVANVRISDRLPQGFRYRKGSARLNGKKIADPNISSDGRTLVFSVGGIVASAEVSLRYVAEVAAGAKLGNAENTASAVAPLTSNTGRASVFVREELFRNKAILIGRVIVGSCDGTVMNDQVGLSNARIVLEDGRYVLTDQEGRWHMDNVRPGTHVVQLDLDSLSGDYEVVACEQNTRFAGRAYSQFVNVKGGTLWRADFHVKRKTASSASPAEREAGPELDERGRGEGAVAKPKKHTQLVEVLPYDDQWLASADPGIEWLHPQQSFNPALPAIKIAVKHDPAHAPQLNVNGEPVHELNYDGAMLNAAKTVALSLWRGVGIREGDNVIELKIVDAQKNVVHSERRIIHYAAGAARAALVEKQSKLIADGKTRPVIAVRFTDKEGKPVRRGVVGEYQVKEPYQSADKLDQIEREPLAGPLDNQPRFQIGEDGIALIELAPTMQTGEAVLTFPLAFKQDNEVRAWLSAAQREWILVGFGEGTLGHRQLSGNMEALKGADADDTLFDQDRVAFYAKGTIKGEYLLTLAYDSARERKDEERLRNLKQAVAPDQFYTLYGDATQQQYDAPSLRKLYLKIEKSQFYAMFGDYDTGLTVTEFSKYSRTFNGFKSEYKSETFSYNAFASSTDQAFVQDEIRGDGTSGLYRLSRGNIVINSDKVRIETRDRFKSEIILEAKELTRFLDYDIDYNLGTIFFREPVQVRDSAFNPVYIVAEYESADRNDKKLTAGGRAAVRPLQDIEIGATHIREGTVGAEGDLSGSDVTWKLDRNTTVKAEFATSDSNFASRDRSGQAWKVEALREHEKLAARAYAREQETGFGLGQQIGSETGTRKFGVDGAQKLSETLQLQGEAYRQKVLDTDAERDVAEGRVQWRNPTYDLTTYGGVRVAKDENGAGEKLDSTQLVGGVAKDVYDKRVTLRASTEVSIAGEAESPDFPNRLLLGADYRLTSLTTLFGEQEFARGERLKADLTRVGLKTRPWTGAELKSSLGNQYGEDSRRLFANLGLVQDWQIDERWRASFGLDRSQTLKSQGVTPLNTNVPLASGGLGPAGDYTAGVTGLHFQDAAWSANTRLELRTSDTDDKVNWLAGAQRNLESGRSAAAGFVYSNTDSNLDVFSRKFDGRVAYAHRPNDSEWIWLDRVDFIDEVIADALGNESHGRKLVNNLNTNWKPNLKTQVALQYGAKYVLDKIDGEDYDGYIDLIGTELRRDVTNDWDVGVQGGLLHSWRGGQLDYSLGASVGYNLLENAWASVGYNFLGFDDEDFSGAEYRAKGLFFNFRFKFDQDTLGLNREGGPSLFKFGRNAPSEIGNKAEVTHAVEYVPGLLGPDGEKR
jgi:uncharacterized repeat protein (TIGR01451 family)